MAGSRLFGQLGPVFFGALANRPALRAAGPALCRVYAQILFSRSPAVGFLLLLATATSPRALLFGLVAVTAATATALFLDLDPEAIERGDYGYNALLVGLGVGATFSGVGVAIGVTLAGAAACVVITAAAKSWLGASSNMPVLTLPFIGVFHLVVSAAPLVGLTSVAKGAPEPAVSLIGSLLPAPIALFAQSLGGLFFLPSVDAGALVLAALLLHSRIAAVLASLGFAAVALLDAHALALPDRAAAHALGYNVMLSTVALGGVWFVPSPASFLLAILGAVVCATLTVGMAAPLARLGLPALILPFNATVLMMLFAARQRAGDRRPKAVDFLPGTPEENLSYLRTRLLRFQQDYVVTFRLPFRGAWRCTQGVDGPLTHQGIWKHAFDFEVEGSDGQLHSGEGTRAEEYHAYRLPVLAAADGTVVGVEGDVPENAIGRMNLAQNWGNHVILYHAPGLYSVVAHLARGSLKVKKGEVVARGAVLGLCGNSGRSARPHIHFHLQSAPELGGATLPCRFNEMVDARSESGAMVRLAAAPEEGQVVRNLEPGDEVAPFLAFRHGETWVMQVGSAIEHITAEVDVYGRWQLRSREHGAALFYGTSGEFFTAYDVIGPRGSLLYALRAALARVPFEAGGALRWRDWLPARAYRGPIMRVLVDALSPFLKHDGIEMEFRMEREGAALVIRGESLRRDRRGEPLIRTCVELARGGGPMRVELASRGRTLAAARAPEPEMVGEAVVSRVIPILH